MTRHDRPLILGHRGASTTAPDNSLEAYRLAADQGADGIECDVRFTADRTIVMHHDPFIDGVGALIDIDFATLRRHHPEIPTIDEMLTALPALLLNIEIKNHPGEPDHDPTHVMATTIVDWIHRHDVSSRVLVTSFDRATVDAVCRADDRIPTGLLLDHRSRFGSVIAGIAADGHAWVLPHSTSLIVGSHRRIAAAHDAGLLVGAWTVDRPRRIRALGRAGIDAVITNDPARALAAYR